MIESYSFLKSVLDTITDHIVVIDNLGEILFVNKTWSLFALDNACSNDKTWNGVNYLEECDKAAGMGDDFGLKSAIGIRSVIDGQEKEFYFEYPCHSADQKRWFIMRVVPFSIQQRYCFVISHQNISERKLAEEEILKLSRTDGLTDIPNRRYFNEFLENEWKRCQRLGTSISLVLIDLDHFKLINDTYGHQKGDDCLQLVAKLLKNYCARPSDLCARYGGEEFALVYGSTSLEHAKILIEKLLNDIRALNIVNKKSPTFPTLTASIGLACMYPVQGNDKSHLIKEADKLLYLAKGNGRNRMAF